MAKFSKEHLRSILTMLEGAEFEEWYENEFMEHIEGGNEAITHEESTNKMLEDLESMLR